MANLFLDSALSGGSGAFTCYLFEKRDSWQLASCVEKVCLGCGSNQV